jgi:nucleoside-diphosphate-sugar epimerase
MILIYGGTGYIGKHIIKELEKNNLEFVLSSTRIYNYTNVENDIKLYKPEFIISAAGYSTPNTIDHYESHKKDLILTNTTGNLILADLTSKYDIHLTLILSGCIYQYKDYSDFHYYKLKFTEESKPNFSGSFYSKNRIQTEELLSNYTHICILRLRMPISNNLYPKSLITKIIKYSTIINIPNSMTVLDDLIPFIHIVMEKNLTGKFNLVNFGIITHSQILDMYIKYINPNYRYSIISEEIQNLKVLAPRSNCHLSNNKISKYMFVPNINESIEKIFIDWSKSLEKYHLN